MRRPLAPFITGFALLCLTAIPWTPPARPGRDIGRGTRIESSTRSDHRSGPRLDGLDAETSLDGASDGHVRAVLLDLVAAPAAPLGSVASASAGPSRPRSPAPAAPASRAPPSSIGR